MTIDLSAVKRIAVQCGATTLGEPAYFTGKEWIEQQSYVMRDNVELLAFAQAIYAMGAAEQKEKDAKICEPANMDDPRDWTEYARTKAECAEAIRSQD